MSTNWQLSIFHRSGKVSFHSNAKERQSQRIFKLLHNLRGGCFYFSSFTEEEIKTYKFKWLILGYIARRVSLVWLSAGKESACHAETWIQSLGWEDLLEKGKSTHSSNLAWRIQELYSQWGCKESDTTKQLSLSLYIARKWLCN